MGIRILTTAGLRPSLMTYPNHDSSADRVRGWASSVTMLLANWRKRKRLISFLSEI